MILCGTQNVSTRLLPILDFQSKLNYIDLIFFYASWKARLMIILNGLIFYVLCLCSAYIYIYIFFFYISRAYALMLKFSLFFKMFSVRTSASWRLLTILSKTVPRGLIIFKSSDWTGEGRCRRLSWCFRFYDSMFSLTILLQWLSLAMLCKCSRNRKDGLLLLKHHI